MPTMFKQAAGLALCAVALAALAAQPAADEPVGPPLVLPIEHRTSALRPSGTTGSGSNDQNPKPIERPSFAGRQVSVFDFEESDRNAEEVPLNWFRAQDRDGRARKGFPQWNQAAFDYTTARSGKASVRVPTRGGSASLRLAGGVIQVFPEAEYRISGYVRTEGLRYAQAAIEVSILDERGEPVAGAVSRTQPLQSPDGWTPVAVTLHGPYPGARSLRIDLLLLQPDQFAVSRVAEQFVPSPEDLSGAAFFDDITVLQLPRVRLTTDRPGNYFVGQIPPTLSAQVRDLTGEDLHAEVVTRDINDAVVDRQEIVLGRGGAKEHIAPRLPRYGWYSVEMNLTRVNRVIADAGQLARTAVLWVADPTREQTERSGSAISAFALLAESPTQRQVAVAAELARLTGASRATLPGSLEPMPAGMTVTPMEQVLSSGSAGNAELSVAITHLPVPVADRLRLDPTDILSLGIINQSEWLTLLTERFSQVGPRVGNWQIGSLKAVHAGDDAKVLAMIAGVRAGVAKFSPNPRLTLPWRADLQWLSGSGGGGPNAGGKQRPFSAVAMVYPASFAASEIERTVQTLQPLRDEALELTIVPETLPPETFGVRAEMNEWAQRAVRLWAASQPAGPGQARPRIGLLDPWDPTSTDATSLLPRPTLAAITTLGRAVAGRKVVGEVPAGPQLHGLILAPEEGGPAIGSLSIGSGALLAWSDAGDTTEQTITGYFGGGTLTMIDLFGNRTPLPPEPGSGRHVIPVSGAPVIVEGIDAHLVKFIAEIKIAPQFIPAVVATHDCEIVVKNPWSTRITGDVQLVPPESGTRSQREWSFAPTVPMAFSIAPGQTARIPFSFIFSTVEEAGPKQIQLLVRLSADRPYPAMRINKVINVGLEDLEMNVSATIGPREDGPNVVITTTVTNSGRLTRTLQLSSHAGGFATQSQPVVDLTPGETAVRRFILPNGAEALAGRKVRVMLVDVDGAERLNKYAIVPN